MTALLSRVSLPLLVLSAVLLSSCRQAPVTPPPAPREPVIAVALGGGGAKGFAHIGVLKVLESHGIKARIVTGTSAGSFVGALYASGKTPFQLQDIALKLEESDIRDLTLSSQGFLAGQKLQDFVNRQVDNQPIQAFPRRFAAVATAMDSGRKVAFNKGNAGQAVRASCSIPNVFVPALINGVRYVDGGLVSPVPVNTAREMGADIIIAVDISARPSAGRSGLLGTLDQTLNIMSLQALTRELAEAEVVIRPDVADQGIADLEARHRSILAGERAAQAQLPAIRAALARFKTSPVALTPPQPALR
ncbi:patatin-like phospholipase family protein [Perlucidibaca piscinae]|uniref:patatin-like phospholipase family protein n=1 Tax=Perlucidibaca piscinae TaxID=392589 RepID=UPI0003B6E0DF|nr:patatin-like phospholipase family protein [Perlucidibaca piscinae]